MTRAVGSNGQFEGGRNDLTKLEADAKTRPDPYRKVYTEN
jgi:hypothetical protein